MNKQDKKVPTLRFKGFTNDWEQRKLGEAAEIIGGGTPSTQISNYWNGDINWYTPAEISNFIYTRKSKRKISMEGLENSSARLLPVGTVLFTSRAGIGKTAILSKEGTTNQGFQSIVPNKKLLDSYFIFSLTNELKKYGETHGAGSTFIEISGRELAKAPLKLPALKEQKKIGGLLHQVDELIFLQQRKLDLLKQLKKGLLQKMFADKGSKRPILRFNGFTDDWEERKLGDIALFSKGKGISKKDLHTHGIYNIVHYADIYKFMPVQDKVLHHSNNKMGVRIGSNSLLFAGSDVTPKGLARTTTIKQENVRVGGDVIIADLSEKHINYFMSYEINMNKRFIYPFITGSTVRHIHGSDLSHLNITFPSLSEQKSIAHIFNLIEHELSLLKIKKSKYQSIKKSLLQQMFI